jgi:hypothetical protein
MKLVKVNLLNFPLSGRTRNGSHGVLSAAFPNRQPPSHSEAFHDYENLLHVHQSSIFLSVASDFGAGSLPNYFSRK